MARQTESRQIEVLRYIHEQVTQKGYPPTVREIGEAVQLSSTSTVHGHLARLEKKGFIQRDPTKPRAIELTKQGLEKIGIRPTTIPVLGVVTAGEPILSSFLLPNDHVVTIQYPSIDHTISTNCQHKETAFFGRKIRRDWKEV